MARDPEMVRRAQDVWYPWACGDGSGRLCSEMMADFAADEVERQAKWLRGQLSEAVAQRDAAVVRAESAEARALKAEARVRELEAKHPAPPYTPRVGDVATPAPGSSHAGAEFVIKSFDERSGFYRMGWIKADEGGTKHSMNDASSMGVLPLRYLRPATPAERAAAGLPPVDAVVAPAGTAKDDRPEHVRLIGAEWDHPLVREVVRWSGLNPVVKTWQLKDGRKVWDIEEGVSAGQWEPADPQPAITAPSSTVAKTDSKPEVLPEHLAFVERMARYGDTDEARALLAAVARRDGGAR